MSIHLRNGFLHYRFLRKGRFQKHQLVRNKSSSFFEAIQCCLKVVHIKKLDFKLFKKFSLKKVGCTNYIIANCKHYLLRKRGN